MTKRIQRSDISASYRLVTIPEPKKPGIKPYDDSKHVHEAIAGIKSGKYKSLNNAAHSIAMEISNGNSNFEAIKKRIIRKIKAA